MGGSQSSQLCQPIQPSTDHLQRVEGCEEEVPAEEATHPTHGSLPPREEGEEEGQDCQHHEDVNTINCIFEEDEDRKLTSCQFCLKRINVNINQSGLWLNRVEHHQTL